MDRSAQDRLGCRPSVEESRHLRRLSEVGGTGLEPVTPSLSILGLAAAATYNLGKPRLTTATATVED
jgi:hypothetical protein